MTDFATALKAALVKDNGLHTAGPIMQILDAPPGRVKRFILKRFEIRVRHYLGLPSRGKFDWNSIDWALVLQQVIPFLLFLLKIFGFAMLANGELYLSFPPTD